LEPSSNAGAELFAKSPAAYLRHVAAQTSSPLTAVLAFDPDAHLLAALDSLGLRLEKRFAHADTRYDYDDPSFKSSVQLFVSVN